MSMTYNGKMEREVFKNIKKKKKKHLAGKFQPRRQFTVCCGPKSCDGPPFMTQVCLLFLLKVYLLKYLPLGS